MKRVLLSGNCNFDHPRISALMTNNFACQITRSKTNAEAISFLEKEKFDLVIVNRIGEFDRLEGMAIILHIQKNENLKKTPVMMITNLPEKMEEAIKNGAVKGFGKEDLKEEKIVIEVLKPYLA
jgi:DNA-binding response OmpR family regulator